jgi:hypothetical protein
MKRPDRQFFPLVTTGVILATAVAGCCSARYETVDTMVTDSRYGAAPPAPEPPSYHQPPTVRGPSEPIPALPHDNSLDRPTAPPRPTEVPQARGNRRGPGLDAFTYDEEEIEDNDDELRFPEARRRPAGGRSLKAILSGLRGKRRAPAPAGGGDPRATNANSIPGHARLAPLPTVRTERVSQTVRIDPPVDDEALAERLPLPLARELQPARTVGGTGTVTRKASASEPMPIENPPRLIAPPVAPESETVTRVAVGSEVRGFDDLVEVDRDRLKAHQPILLYTALMNFRSQASRAGFETMTRSRLEIRTVDGEIVWSQPLGSVTDLASKPRHEYFLAHDITVPATLPPDDYTFVVRIDDLLAEQTTVGEIDVRIQGGS